MTMGVWTGGRQLVLCLQKYKELEEILKTLRSQANILTELTKTAENNVKEIEKAIQNTSKSVKIANAFRRDKRKERASALLKRAKQEHDELVATVQSVRTITTTAQKLFDYVETNKDIDKVIWQSINIP